jgi:CheY-like chemotaxis protein
MRASDASEPRIVLLIEDDPADQELARRAIADTGWRAQVYTVDDGDAGLEFLHGRGRFTGAPRPDLVLLDLNMPRLRGEQVLAHVRGDPKLRDVPVVVLTTSAREADVQRSYELGCNSFLTKPDDVQDYLRLFQTTGTYWLACVVLPSRPAAAAAVVSRE